MLPLWLKWNALVEHHGELSWLADEHLEGSVLLVEAAQGQRVRVQVQGESQSLPGSLLRLHLLVCFTPLQGYISCGTCSYPELTEDHVLTSAYVKIFRIVRRNAINKSF